MWIQKEILLKPKSRGFHLVTSELLSQLPELAEIESGLVHFFLQHTSASLCISENADSTVRDDMERYLNHAVPDDAPFFVHTYEGPDDMPAHIKSALLGCELSIPVKGGGLLLGTWQGIFLGEHRDYGGARRVMVTLNGESRNF